MVANSYVGFCASSFLGGSSREISGYSNSGLVSLWVSVVSFIFGLSVSSSLVVKGAPPVSTATKLVGGPFSP